MIRDYIPNLLRSRSLCRHTKRYPHNTCDDTKERLRGILGDPGAVSRVDKMFVVKVYCKIVNFHHEHFIDPTNCSWVSEDGCVVDYYSSLRSNLLVPDLAHANRAVTHQ